MTEYTPSVTGTRVFVDEQSRNYDFIYETILDPNLAILDPNSAILDPNLAILGPNLAILDPN